MVQSERYLLTCYRYIELNPVMVKLYLEGVAIAVTNGIVANGLKIDRVDGVFNEYDAEAREPHYHFTQWFLASQ
jgi:hypothetical protein